MNKKNFFDDDEQKYKALEKENNTNKVSKPKKVNSCKFEEIKDSSEYQVYESLDNLNSFTVEKQSEMKNFFLKIFSLENFVNIFAKFITKLLILILENNFISQKFLGKFATKLRNTLIKILLFLQIKLLLMQFIFLTLMLRLQLKALGIINSKIRQKEISVNKNLDFFDAKTNQYSKKIPEYKTFLNFDSFSDFDKKIAKNFNPTKEKLFFLSDVQVGKLSKEYDKLFEINSQNLNFDLKNPVAHGGKDFFFYKIEGNLSVVDYQRNGFDLFKYLVKFIIQTAQVAKDFILNHNLNEEKKITTKNQEFRIEGSKEISNEKNKENISFVKENKETIHVFEIGRVSEQVGQNQEKGL